MQIEKAIKEFIRCTALARIVHGDGHWKLARSYVNLGEGYLDLKGIYDTFVFILPFEINDLANHVSLKRLVCTVLLYS